jgi:quercetin dioxygenase-like cupin family protein
MIKKKRRCLNHPAMECPTPNEPCVFLDKREASGKSQKSKPTSARDCPERGVVMNKKKELKDEETSTKSVDVNSLIEYQKASVVSRTLIDKKAGTVTIFAFDEGQGLSEHIAPYDALVQITDGEVDITISGRTHRVNQGQIITMPANHPHALKAAGKFKMLLIMIKA